MIRVNNISKDYNINAVSSIRDILSSPFKSRQQNIHHALQNVSFDVEKGTILGIIGKNGSGKSTLLKVLSRITYPTSGSAIIEGSVSSLIEIGTGFHPELTGRENVYFNGALLGMKKKIISEKFDEIVSFSGIGKYIDVPVKQYSSGMYVRLAFAVAAHLESEILLIDEVLSVGDYEFQMKCLAKVNDLQNEGKTIIFVSHDLFMIQKLCDNCLWLDEGIVKEKGLTLEVIDKYLHSSLSPTKKTRKKSKVYIDKVTFNNNNSHLINLKQGVICFNVISKEIIKDFALIFIIKNQFNQILCVCNSLLEFGAIDLSIGNTNIKCIIENIPFPSGEYYLDYYLKEGISLIIKQDNFLKFNVISQKINEPKVKYGVLVKQKWVL